MRTMKRPMPLLLAVFMILAVHADAALGAGDAPHAVVYLSGDDTSPEGKVYKEGDIIQSQNGVALRLTDGSHLEVEAKSSVKIEKLSSKLKPDSTVIRIFHGAVRSQVAKQPRAFYVITPTAVAGVRGTDFSVEYEPGSSTSVSSGDDVTEVDVYEGQVDLTSGEKVHPLRAGEGASASRKEAIKRKMHEKIREKWEDHREQVIERVKKRYKLGDDVKKEDLKELLKKLPEDAREELKSKIMERMKGAKERIQKRLADEKQKRQANQQENRQDRRENVKERAVKTRYRRANK